MKNQNLLIVAAAGIGLYMLSKVASGTMMSGSKTSPIVNGSARTAAVNTSPSNNIFSPGYGLGNGVGLTLGGEGAGYNVANVYDPLGFIATTK